MVDAELGTTLLLAAGAGVLSLLARRRRGAAAQRIVSSDRLRLVLRGTVIHSRSRTELEVLHDAVVGVRGNGRVLFIESDHTEPLGPTDVIELRKPPAARYALDGAEVVTLPRGAFVVPGFVDTHTHAPQFAFAGTGYDLTLLDWLQTYTFPSEARFECSTYARKVCANAVRRTLASGSTSCVYFASTHTDASLLLARLALEAGQRAFVGKASTRRDAPAAPCRCERRPGGWGRWAASEARAARRRCRWIATRRHSTASRTRGPRWPRPSASSPA